MANQHQKTVNDLLGFFYIAYNPVLAKIFGRNEALLLGLLLYWHGRGDDPVWIYKTAQEIEAQTALTPEQQKLAIKHLKATPYVQQIRAGYQGVRYFKLDYELLLKDLPSLVKTHQLDELVATNKKVFNPRTLLRRIHNNIQNKNQNNTGYKARAGPESIGAVFARKKY